MRENVNLSAQDIQGILPHRPPFLLIDKVTELEVGKSAVALKNVTINEPFFQGHFPGHPVMPGVLILEAMAQTGAVALLKMPEYEGRIALFAAVDGVRFRRQVVPGDTLRLEVELTALRKSIGKGVGKAYVDAQLACEAELTFAIAK
ncbi:3-hydroxyacyl-ACP dehydratase FabZ [Heliobacterium chlorum]|uniref:3-hydroxyacyl-[acyl-carrier-protein] dehydratase FabZ n=1 Tax=Heliobacterium chlorum TaxID=2698 RepID=A0ABR7T477_HELCL|nr:3-hydroxyacyl-ACP dehydratase FabZ [Heliobacterium chlorum]MBC9784481.1 3-hydroxyacyl-ACP dehydratase FabZ [Heliobacterium chlorum]